MRISFHILKYSTFSHFKVKNNIRKNKVIQTYTSRAKFILVQALFI
jgi:hypothetical protein